MRSKIWGVTTLAEWLNLCARTRLGLLLCSIYIWHVLHVKACGFEVGLVSILRFFRYVASSLFTSYTSQPVHATLLLSLRLIDVLIGNMNY